MSAGYITLTKVACAQPGNFPDYRLTSGGHTANFPCVALDQTKINSNLNLNSRNASPSTLPYEALQEVQANKRILSSSNPETDSVTHSGLTQPGSMPNIRPGPGRRVSSGFAGEKSGLDEGKPSSKRAGWISSLSSKFSSQSQQNGSTVNTNGITKPQQSGAQMPSSPAVENSMLASPTRSFSKSPTEPLEELAPYVPHQPKPSGSFLGALRRLSTAAPQTMSKVTINCNAVCPRRTLNIDQRRQRCALKELDQSRLRRVAFSVDVEIAGGPRYLDSDEFSEKLTTQQDKKLFEKGEGAALKNPQAAKEIKDKMKMVRTSAQEVPSRAASNTSNPPEVDSDFDVTDPYEMLERANADERRRQRSEKRRRRSDDAGASHKEAMHLEDMNIFATANPHQDGFASAIPAQQPPQSPREAQARPTTDPLRVYRRCCQLREAPILKRISEQLGNTANCSVETIGVVNCLDLTGSRMQLSDVVCLGDWLAVVPVKKLLLEDANLTDEGVRIVLAGLLAAKIPGLAKRKHNRSSPSRLRDTAARPSSGVIEKITLKNNPRLTRYGWSHICLFINMSSSIKAIDVSLIPFPQSSDRGDNLSNARTSPDAHLQTMAELLSKSISGRIAPHSHLEELIFAECGLTAPQVGNIVDGVISIDLARLGLASNNLDEEGLAHVARYIRSGSCKGLDLGGNDLRGRLSVIAKAMGKPMWALSLANCNLDSSSLVPLFPVLIKIPDFRFIDLSHNRNLFHAPRDQPGNDPSPTALSILRRYLRQLPSLRRIHLMDVGLSPADAIGLAEVLPEGRNLNHISILENPKLTALASATESSTQEEACAVYASLMVAARVSKMLFCIDVDIPSHESTEMVRALARQVVAYTLRNMERYTAADAITSTDPASVVPDLSETDRENVPDALMHLLWPAQETDNPPPDHDYIVGGTGLVKALDYVLGQKNADIRRPSTALRPDTPSQIRDSEIGKAQAKDMSKNLLESARKIRTRLQPAIGREAESGDEMAYRK